MSDALEKMLLARPKLLSEPPQPTRSGKPKEVLKSSESEDFLSIIAKKIIDKFKALTSDEKVAFDKIIENIKLIFDDITDVNKEDLLYVTALEEKLKKKYENEKLKKYIDSDLNNLEFIIDLDIDDTDDKRKEKIINLLDKKFKEDKQLFTKYIDYNDDLIVKYTLSDGSIYGIMLSVENISPEKFKTMSEEVFKNMSGGSISKLSRIQIQNIPINLYKLLDSDKTKILINNPQFKEYLAKTNDQKTIILSLNIHDDIKQRLRDDITKSQTQSELANQLVNLFKKKAVSDTNNAVITTNNLITQSVTRTQQLPAPGVARPRRRKGKKPIAGPSTKPTSGGGRNKRRKSKKSKSKSKRRNSKKRRSRSKK